MGRTVAIVLLVLLATAPAAGAFPGRNGLIAYGWTTLDEPELGPFRYSDGIRALKPGGGAARTLRQCVRSPGLPDAGDCAPSQYADPSWSPDGTRIVFDAGRALALLDGDGGALRLLPPRGEDDGEPVFSPGGSRLAVSTARGADGARELWTSDVYGHRARRLAANAASPSWSERGAIAFVRGGQVWTVRPDGRGLRQLTRRGGLRPAWSPHGSRIAFLRRGTVNVMNADGGGLRALRALRGVEQVRWSPDGRRLLVERSEAGIEIANRDGSGARLIVQDAVGATYNYAARGVDWQPLR
ncbi:PD40 domain-containing protein [Conexibacter arvalis]|uniref:TolB protein n=1 Tax=Conexibacter arvalis TaxID=912552 RepID=A0A840II37_9ACTN|nr:PD40 domain-containing protein [Conexibacter arvalis]MBB4664439.1 TolB protein [Conexibacter arvalis]